MSMLLAATAVIACAGAAQAANGGNYNSGHGRNGDNAGINNTSDAAMFGNGYNYGYDDGVARRQRDNHFRADTWHAPNTNRGYERGAYYYGSDCGNNATGTVVGAIAGGVIGSSVSHGNGGATVAGVILGGLAGNAISRDMNCGDRRYALTSYSAGFEGRLGDRHDWRSDDSRNHGSFTPIREYSRDGNTCRDFRETSTRDGRNYNRNGTACRQSDGNWYMQ